MLDIATMTNTLVDTFREIPELVAMCANQDPNYVSGYIDSGPPLNSILTAIYDMSDGSVLVAWDETEFTSNDQMSMWVHRFRVYVRALPDDSSLDMARTLINGIPTGQNLRWRFLQLLPELYASNVIGMVRDTDAEYIDYLNVQVELQEMGDA
jgi:hypothetical protein